MTNEQAISVFRKWVDAFPLKQDAAAALGISAPYVTDLYRGTRPLPDWILAHLGLKREIVKSAK